MDEKKAIQEFVLKFLNSKNIPSSIRFKKTSTVYIEFTFQRLKNTIIVKNKKFLISWAASRNFMLKTVEQLEFEIKPKYGHVFFEESPNGAKFYFKIAQFMGSDKEEYINEWLEIVFNQLTTLNLNTI